jgi:tetratricopeptide (TPR) repeat protein
LNWRAALPFGVTLLAGWSFPPIVRAAAAETAAPFAARGWSRVAAESAFERAEQLVTRGETFSAAAAYTQAIRIDPSFGPAYLGLAEIRRVLGDARETEWLLTQAVRLADVRAEAHARRARFYKATGKAELGLMDLEAAAESEPSPERLRELGVAYVERRVWPAALAAYRRLRSALPGTASAALRAEVSETVQALGLLAAEADAVQRDDGDRDWVRRSLQHQARR